MKNFIQRIKNSNFIGTQLSRFKMGMGYYSAFMSTLSAMMLIKTAYPALELEWILIASPLPILAALYLGYLMDRKNINTMDLMKGNEMANRFLLTSDLKSQEFQLIQTKMLLKALNELKSQGTTMINDQELEEEYNKYLEKWESPYQKSKRE